MSIPDWSPKPPRWLAEELNLLPSQLEEPPPITLQTILEKSEAFPREFPIESIRCKILKELVAENILERNANSAYPIIHENVLHLCAQYILHKRRYGNAIEKAFYEQMNLLQLIDKLLTKRAVFSYFDIYLLLDGASGPFTWEIIGTPEERKPLLLQNCLSYEEIKLSGFLSVSSYTYFVNVGNQWNCGDYTEERDKIQDEGVIIGIVGPTLDKKDVMEFQEVIITAKQNTKENGYGKRNKPTVHHLFANLYEEECLEFKGIVEKRKRSNVQRYTSLKNGEILDNFVYYKRLLFSMDTLFIEANHRALEKNTTAFIHVVGIGLGMLTSGCQTTGCQTKIFTNTCRARIKTLGKHLHNVSDVCFAWFDDEACLEYKDGDTIPIEGHPLKGIKIHISNRNPHSRLTGEHQGKLLVVSYDSNGNTLPGNLFWNRSTAQDNNAATASSTQTSELHNPFINSKVCASNLRVIVDRCRVVHIKQYVNIVKKRAK